MIELVWEIVVKEADRGRFELSYGPGGAWSTLFARRAGFFGVTVLRDIDDPRRYLVLEVWETVERRAQALADQQAAAEKLEATLAGWVKSRRALGVYSVVGAAAVRPHGHGKAARGRRGAGD